MFLVFEGEDYQIYAKRGDSDFISLETLKSKIGKGGTKAIRDLLNIPYKSINKPLLTPQNIEKLQGVRNDLPDVDNIEMVDLPNAAETAVKEIETSFINEQEVQTDMDKREMDGILEAMTSVKEEIANELGKLNETNKDIAKEKDKLEQAKADEDKFQIERINKRLRELEFERSSRLEAINIYRDKLRSQINRIKETINKILKEDTTLGERIKTLFREQGITIVSVLTAFGMIIGVIVETIIPTTGGGSITPKPPSSQGGVKEWIKNLVNY